MRQYTIILVTFALLQNAIAFPGSNQKTAPNLFERGGPVVCCNLCQAHSECSKKCVNCGPVVCCNLCQPDSECSKNCDPDGFYSSLDMHDTCSIYNPTVLLSAMSSAPAGQFIIITQTLRPPRQWKPYDPDRLPSETITERIILESARMWLGIPAGFQ
ncbi:hypothetical protein MJO29_011485, partial [Puccinia striiformis f. sp. tritici]